MNTSKSNPENHPLFALLLSLTGFVVYLAQSIRFAIRLPSILDEAAYLFKGYLYATGAYQPFEPYGPWANKMPLVFLIPGWFQQLFGPGLRTGRVFAILLGVLMLLGLWLLLRRLANLWWAAAGVWIIALTPAMIRNYSVFWSQGLTATMLIWVLALTLGEDRKPWQTTLGALLAALMALSRQNMMPFIVLLIPFIFWQNGKKAGIWAAVVSVVSFLIFHALYFPEIFRLWAIWLPGSLRNILEDWGLIIQTRASWQPSYTNLDRLRAFWEGVRFHYLLSALILSTLLFFPWFKAAKIHPKKKSILFLLVNLGLLGVMHSMASLTGSYCVYCFTNYLDFFIIIAIPLIALTFSGWQQSGPRWRQVAGLVFSGLMGVLIFLPFLPKISVWLLSRPMPRVKNGKFLEGTAALSQLVEGKFHLNLQTQQIPMANLFTGLTIFSLIALISFLLLRLVNHKRAENRAQIGYVSLFVLFALSAILSPLPMLSAGIPLENCGNVITNMETVGAFLNQAIPAGSTVYWAGGPSIMPLMYVDGINFYPLQINGIYPLRLSDETEKLPLFGFYNYELQDQWRDEADVIVVREKSMENLLENLNPDARYDQSTASIPLCASDAGSRLYVLIQTDPQE